MSATILTYGCRLAGYEGDVIRRHTAQLPDTLVGITCAVTLQAEREARHAVARADRAQAGRPIAVTGCVGQIHPTRCAALPGVTRVLGEDEKLHADNPPPVGLPITGFDGKARAFVAVQHRVWIAASDTDGLVAAEAGVLLARAA